MTKNEAKPQGASARPRRSPLSGRNRLEVQDKEPGYVYRIVNDVDDRVARLEEQGYVVVPNAKVGAAGSKRVDNPSALGSSSYISVGQGTKAVVMRQRDEYYKEDQAAKQQLVDDMEQTMKSPKNVDYGTVKGNSRFSEG